MAAREPEQKKILVVDDESGIRETLSEILTMVGFEVKVAENGMEALEILKGETFDVLVTDLSMPKMNGAELIEASKAHVKPEMCNIVMSGFTEHSISALFLIGVDAAFSKPFKMQHLKSCIEELLKAADSKKMSAGRAFRRCQTTQCVITDCKKRNDENAKTATYSVLNIAAGGICIALNELSFSPGEVVQFTLELKDSPIKSYEKIQAVVRWISAVSELGNKFRCGLEFQELSPRALGQVAYLINCIRTSNSSILQF